MMFDKDSLILFALLKGKNKQYNSIDDFPDAGNKGIIYIDMSNKSIYVWNEEINQYISVGGNLENYYTKTEINDLLLSVWYVQDEECIYIKSGIGESSHNNYKCYELVTGEEWNTMKENNTLKNDVLYVLLDDDKIIY